MDNSYQNKIGNTTEQEIRVTLTYGRTEGIDKGTWENKG